MSRWSFELPIDIRVAEGTLHFGLEVSGGVPTRLRRASRADWAIVVDGIPIPGARIGNVHLRDGHGAAPIAPMDEIATGCWAGPSVQRGGDLRHVLELTACLNNTLTIDHTFEAGQLRSMDASDEAPPPTDPDMVRARVSWHRRLRWRTGDMSTLEMVQGTAIRSGSWAGLDLCQAYYDLAQPRLSRFAVRREILWLAESLEIAVASRGRR